MSHSVNSPGYIISRPITSWLTPLPDTDSTKNPMMLDTRTHLPPAGHSNSSPPGCPGESVAPGTHVSDQLLASFRHMNSSTSTTAIGTIRGLNGAHSGAQL